MAAGPDQSGGRADKDLAAGGLTVSGLAVARGGATILSGIGFDLRPGQALVLSGPNGVGKTTLLRTIAGLQPPVAGTISADPDMLAYAGHADAVKATLTVAENLRFWAQIHGAGDVGAVMAALDLAELAARPGQSLSAGQRRRLGLARLMLTGCRLWLLDEPTVSLDAASVARFAGVLRAHLADGGMALLASHIDLGLPEAVRLDLTPYRSGGAVAASGTAGFDEAFL